MKNPELINILGVKENISSLFNSNNCNFFLFQDTVEDSNSGEELTANINKLKLFSKFALDRETKEYARLVTTDCFGNVHYLIASK